MVSTFSLFLISVFTKFNSENTHSTSVVVIRITAAAAQIFVMFGQKLPVDFSALWTTHRRSQGPLIVHSSRSAKAFFHRVPLFKAGVWV